MKGEGGEGREGDVREILKDAEKRNKSLSSELIFAIFTCDFLIDIYCCALLIDELCVLCRWLKVLEE